MKTLLTHCNHLRMKTVNLEPKRKWDCSDGILPLSWKQKMWTILLGFHPLPIQPHPTNSLEDTEF
jgi:hypothetical protein